MGFEQSIVCSFFVDIDINDIVVNVVSLLSTTGKSIALLSNILLDKNVFDFVQLISSMDTHSIDGKHSIRYIYIVRRGPHINNDLILKLFTHIIKHRKKIFQIRSNCNIGTPPFYKEIYETRTLISKISQEKCRIAHDLPILEVNQTLSMPLTLSSRLKCSDINIRTWGDALEQKTRQKIQHDIMKYTHVNFPTDYPSSLECFLKSVSPDMLSELMERKIDPSFLIAATAQLSQDERQGNTELQSKRYQRIFSIIKQVFPALDDPIGAEDAELSCKFIDSLKQFNSSNGTLDSLNKNTVIDLDTSASSKSNLDSFHPQNLRFPCLPPSTLSLLEHVRERDSTERHLRALQYSLQIQDDLQERGEIDFIRPLKTPMSPRSRVALLAGEYSSCLSLPSGNLMASIDRITKKHKFLSEYLRQPEAELSPSSPLPRTYLSTLLHGLNVLVTKPDRWSIGDGLLLLGAVSPSLLAKSLFWGGDSLLAPKKQLSSRLLSQPEPTSVSLSRLLLSPPPSLPPVFYWTPGIPDPSSIPHALTNAQLALLHRNLPNMRRAEGNHVFSAIIFDINSQVLYLRLPLVGDESDACLIPVESDCESDLETHPLPNKSNQNNKGNHSKKDEHAPHGALKKLARGPKPKPVQKHTYRHRIIDLPPHLLREISSLSDSLPIPQPNGKCSIIHRAGRRIFIVLAEVSDVIQEVRAVLDSEFLNLRPFKGNGPLKHQMEQLLVQLFGISFDRNHRDLLMSLYHPFSYHAAPSSLATAVMHPDLLAIALATLCVERHLSEQDNNEKTKDEILATPASLFGVSREVAFLLCPFNALKLAESALQKSLPFAANPLAVEAFELLGLQGCLPLCADLPSMKTHDACDVSVEEAADMESKDTENLLSTEQGFISEQDVRLVSVFKAFITAHAPTLHESITLQPAAVISAFSQHVSNRLSPADPSSVAANSPSLTLSTQSLPVSPGLKNYLSSISGVSGAAPLSQWWSERIDPLWKPHVSIWSNTSSKFDKDRMDDPDKNGWAIGDPRHPLHRWVVAAGLEDLTDFGGADHVLLPILLALPPVVGVVPDMTMRCWHVLGLVDDGSAVSVQHSSVFFFENGLSFLTSWKLAVMRRHRIMQADLLALRHLGLAVRVGDDCELSRRLMAFAKPLLNQLNELQTTPDLHFSSSDLTARLQQLYLPTKKHFQESLENLCSLTSFIKQRSQSPFPSSSVSPRLKPFAILHPAKNKSLMKSVGTCTSDEQIQELSKLSPLSRGVRLTISERHKLQDYMLLANLDPQTDSQFITELTRDLASNALSEGKQPSLQSRRQSLVNAMRKRRFSRPESSDMENEKEKRRKRKKEEISVKSQSVVLNKDNAKILPLNNYSNIAQLTTIDSSVPGLPNSDKSPLETPSTLKPPHSESIIKQQETILAYYADLKTRKLHKSSQLDKKPKAKSKAKLRVSSMPDLDPRHQLSHLSPLQPTSPLFANLHDPSIHNRSASANRTSYPTFMPSLIPPYQQGSYNANALYNYNSSFVHRNLYPASTPYFGVSSTNLTAASAATSSVNGHNQNYHNSVTAGRMLETTTATTSQSTEAQQEAEMKFLESFKRFQQGATQSFPNFFSFVPSQATPVTQNSINNSFSAIDQRNKNSSNVLVGSPSISSQLDTNIDNHTIETRNNPINNNSSSDYAGVFMPTPPNEPS